MREGKLSIDDERLLAGCVALTFVSAVVALSSNGASTLWGLGWTTVGAVPAVGGAVVVTARGNAPQGLVGRRRAAAETMEVAAEGTAAAGRRRAGSRRSCTLATSISRCAVGGARAGVEAELLCHWELFRCRASNPPKVLTAALAGQTTKDSLEQAFGRFGRIEVRADGSGRLPAQRLGLHRPPCRIFMSRPTGRPSVPEASRS
eukprot:COSAG02_NODE_947_length_15716_cov_7.567971_6_plen_204_part_00